MRVLKTQICVTRPQCVKPGPVKNTCAARRVRKRRYTGPVKNASESDDVIYGTRRQCVKTCWGYEVATQHTYRHSVNSFRTIVTK